MDHINALLAAGSALLLAEERLLRTLPDHASRAYSLADGVLTAARAAVSVAIEQPGDARQRLSLLRAAMEVDGIESPLVARAAAALAEASAAVEAAAA